MAVDNTFAKGTNYRKQGNKVDEVGGALNILDGGTLSVAGLIDTSSDTETILVAGAISLTKSVTKISAASGAYAVTLAAPDSTNIGQIKVIEMTVAGNDVTLALTNVQGGTAATTATFNAVDETLTLVAGTNKWTVLNETGVTLT